MFNPQLNFPRDIKYSRSTQSTIDSVFSRIHVGESRGVGEDGLVPVTHVRIGGDEFGEAVPLVRGSDEERVLGSDVGEGETGHRV